MPPQRDWHVDEFLLVLYSPDLTDEELTRRLHQHSVEEMQAARQGIHAFHTGQDVSHLPPLMRRLMKRKDRAVVCPLCKTEF
jgi:hypothetical protein